MRTIEESIKAVTEKGWHITVTFKPEESYCFVFNSTGSELGFAKGVNESVIDLAFARAIDKQKTLDERQRELRKKQPLLYEEF